jgi:hypothetical protein
MMRAMTDYGVEIPLKSHKVASFPSDEDRETVRRVIEALAPKKDGERPASP